MMPKRLFKREVHGNEYRSHPESSVRSVILRHGWGIIPVMVGLLLVGCDLEITNPGPVADEFLDPPEAHPALVVGMERALAGASNWFSWSGSAAALEIRSSGGTGVFGMSPQLRLGELSQMNTEWAMGHRARQVAEDGIRRMREVLGEGGFATSESGGKALVYAGFANRMLGENVCQAVIDGGPAEDYRVHLERAESQFSEALQILGQVGNNEFENAARAGRASVRAALGRWSEAVDDAQSVPRDFVFASERSPETDETRNRFARGNENQPWRATTVWSTYFEDYYVETGDPRTPWGEDPDNPLGEQPIPWRFELKYGPGNFTAPIALVSGHEMQLIVAESLLRGGQWTDAMEIVNERRSDLGVPSWSPSSEEEAWTALKLERFIELWLEARALFDHRRYAEENTPGPLPSEWDMTGRDLCFPISEAERDTNPNIPQS